MYVQYISLTVVAIETSPDELVVVRDLVDNSTETADTVLYNLRSRHKQMASCSNEICMLRAICKSCKL